MSQILAMLLAYLDLCHPPMRAPSYFGRTVKQSAHMRNIWV